jgi:hypothetical protein
MEITGARWSLDGAEGVPRLRALAGNGDFDEYSAFHLNQEDSATTTAAIGSPSPLGMTNRRPNCPPFKRAAP